nr:hypothetical protein [Tanacetum cinerariifolium]
MGATREEFKNFLSASLTDRTTEQVRNQLPRILPEEVSNFAPPVIKKMIQKSLNQVNLAKVSSQPQSTYKAAVTLIDFDLKKILIDKMNSSESYLTAPEHQECYDGLVKYYNLEKDFFSSYDVYSLKRRQDDKDNDEGPSARSDRGLKKRKTSKVTEPTTSPKTKYSSSRSSKDINLNQNLLEKPTDPDWNEDKIPQKGPMQNWLMTLAASTSTGKSLKEFDELMSTLIDFSSYILNGLKIKNLTQEILLGPALRLLKGTRSNYAELEYDFEECYKALSEKLDWENHKGSDYPFDLSKPLPLIMRIEDMVPDIWSPVKVAYDKYALWGISHWRDQLTQVSVMRNHGYGYLEKIVLTNLSRDDVADFAIALWMFTKDLRKRHTYTPYKNPQGFIYADDYERNRLMRSDELYKFSDATLTRLLSSLEDITKNIDMEYLRKRRWRTLEKKRAHCMIKDINKLLKERRIMRSLEKFIDGRLYETDLRLLQRTI